jgi:long-chain fatty acid transport protein
VAGDTGGDTDRGDAAAINRFTQAQIFFGGTYGATFSNGVSWGVTVSLDYARFEAEGLQAFSSASSDPTKLSNNGVDTATGIGLKVGLRGDFASGGTWGVSYRFKTDMSKFDKYAGLLKNQGDLDIAPTFTVGVALPIAAKTTLALDYHYIDYEAVDSIADPTSLFPPNKFGSSNGPGFGWNSISVIKAGIEVQTSDTWFWRGGINYGESPLDENEFSTAFLVPATITTNVSAGFTKKLKNNNELSMVYVRSLNECQTGAFSPAFGGGTLEACMEQNFLEVSYGMIFQ